MAVSFSAGRSQSSRLSVQTRKRTAALVAPYTSMPGGVPCEPTTEPIVRAPSQKHPRTLFSEPFCNSKSDPFTRSRNDCCFSARLLTLILPRRVDSPPAKPKYIILNQSVQYDVRARIGHKTRWSPRCYSYVKLEWCPDYCRMIRRRPKRRESTEKAPGPIRKSAVVIEREKTKWIGL